MPAQFNRVALLGGSYDVRNGFRVRLRMARSSDVAPIRALLERSRGTGELELVPLVQFDPRRRCVICATALIDGAETLVGVGSIALDGDGLSDPDTLLVADEHADEIGVLLADALAARAAISGTRAA
ncbi:MAG TPA: hypothetical protein VGH24_07590 [Solirubrobacteraceae bacterium]